MPITRFDFDNDPQIKSLSPADQAYVRQQYFNQNVRPLLANTRPAHQQAMLQAWGIAGNDGPTEQYQEYSNPVDAMVQAFNNRSAHSTQLNLFRAGQRSLAGPLNDLLGTHLSDFSGVETGPEVVPTNPLATAGAVVGDVAGSLSDLTNLPIGFGGAKAAAAAAEPLMALGGKEIALNALKAAAKAIPHNAAIGAGFGAGNYALGNYADNAPITASGLAQSAGEGALFGGTLGAVPAGAASVLEHPEVQAGLTSLADRILGRVPPEPTMTPSVNLMGGVDPGAIPQGPRPAYDPSLDQFQQARPTAPAAPYQVAGADPQALVNQHLANWGIESSPGIQSNPEPFTNTATPAETGGGSALYLSQHPEPQFTENPGPEVFDNTPQQVEIGDTGSQAGSPRFSDIAKRPSLDLPGYHAELGDTFQPTHIYRGEPVQAVYSGPNGVGFVNADGQLSMVSPQGAHQAIPINKMIMPPQNESARLLQDAIGRIRNNEASYVQFASARNPDGALDIEMGTTGNPSAQPPFAGGHGVSHVEAKRQWEYERSNGRGETGQEAMDHIANAYAYGEPGEPYEASNKATKNKLRRNITDDSHQATIAKRNTPEEGAEFITGRMLSRRERRNAASGAPDGVQRSNGMDTADQGYAPAAYNDMRQPEGAEADPNLSQPGSDVNGQNGQPMSDDQARRLRERFGRNPESGSPMIWPEPTYTVTPGPEVHEGPEVGFAEEGHVETPGHENLLSGESGSFDPGQPFNKIAQARVKKAVQQYNAKITQLEDVATRADAKGNSVMATAARNRAAELRQEMQSLNDTMAAFRERPAAKVDPASINPDDHMNFDKHDLSDGAKDYLRERVQDNRARMGEDHKNIVTFEDLQREADAKVPGLGAELDRMKPGQSLDRAQFKAANDTLDTLGEHAHALREELRTDDGQMTDEVRQQKQTELDVLERDIDKLLSFTLPTGSENGRNLSLMRAMGRRTFSATYWINQAKRISGELNDSDTNALKEIIQRGAHAQANGDEAGVQQARVDLTKKLASLKQDGLLETVSQGVRANLLSGPQTIGRITLSHLGLQFMEGTAKTLGSTIESLFMSPFTGHETVLSPVLRLNKVLGATGHAIYQGIIKDGPEILWHGMTKEQLSRLNLPRELNSNVPVLGPIANLYTRAVFRVHSAVYHPFFVYSYKRALQDMAEMTARKEAKFSPGVNVAQRADELVRNPSAAMEAEATAAGAFATFSQPNALSEGYQQMRGRLPNWGKFIADHILRFTHVPSNIPAVILNYALGGPIKATTTMGIAMKRAMTGELANALTPEDQKAIAMGFGRGLVGIPLIYMGYKLAAAGMMTGYYQTSKAKVDEAAGRVAGAIKLGGHWNPFNAISPFANLLTIGASLYESHASLANPLAVITTGLKTVADQPFLKGSQDVQNLMENPAKNYGRFIGNQLAPYIPGAVAVSDIAKATDPYDRAISKDPNQAILDTLKSRIPGLRETLPVKVDALGQPVTHPDGWQALNPLAGLQAKEDTNPAVAELLRLAQSDNPADHPTLGNEANKIRLGKASIPLDAEQQQTLEQHKGQALNDLLNRVVQSPGYQNLNDDQKTALVKRIKSASEEIGRGQYIAANRDSVVAALRQALQQRVQATPASANTGQLQQLLNRPASRGASL